MSGALFLAAALAPIVPAPIVAAAETDPCVGLAEPARAGTALPVEVDDLVTIADIGPAIGEHNARAVAVSPRGDRIAFVVKRANARANAYCQRLLLVAANDTGKAVELARGGAYLRADFPLRDFAFVRAGWDKPNPPRWSPTGDRIAYLRREDDTTQVWIVDPENVVAPARATTLRDDVEDFAWTGDGEALVVATRPGIREAMRAIGQEGAQGYLFDERFSPQFADHPIAPGPVPRTYTRVTLGDGSMQPASEAERALLEPRNPTHVPTSGQMYRPGPHGYSAWIEPRYPDRILSETRIVVAGPDGQRQVCGSDACDGVLDIWWSDDGEALYLQQRTGWARSEHTLARWAPGEDAPQVVLRTEDLLIGCASLGPELVCGREGSAQPRRLVAIDMRTGAERTVHDPNAVLRSRDFGEVRRLRFRNTYGVESFADLALPPGHEEGERHPMVVVQYSSRGFLRGGTGDEVPVHPLAARGFAVLSFQRPGLLPEAYRARNEIETYTMFDDPWADRRNVLSSLELAIEQAIATGAVDARRLGIDGFSDGGATAQFALINTDLFKVASFGTCCQDRAAQPLAAGPRFTDYLRAMGYRYFEHGGDAFWKPMSMLDNIDKLDIPILIQASDSEYEGALDVVEAFSHRGKPIELRVFPGETHYKWQPAHRRAIYDRNIDWFAFWLAHEMDCAPGKADQYRRWFGMKGAPERSKVACRDPASTAP